MEEGEVEESYDPTLEWPGEASSGQLTVTSYDATEAPTYRPPVKDSLTFRLLVTRTSILPKRQRIAIIDGYSEVQFGRDVQSPASSSSSWTPRIRLKEMQVSKWHATVYWDSSRQEWAAVDMGSVHGTFVKSSSTAAPSDGTRLSPPRAASVPKVLKHLDTLVIGSTSFCVHIHRQLPCTDCSPLGGDEIPLFPPNKKLTPLGESTRDDAGVSTIRVDPKKALHSLKRSLLSSQRRSPGVAAEPSTYVDRSAKRRALQSSLHSDAPGLPSAIKPPPTQEESMTSTPSPLLAEPPAPVPTSNRGHQLLMKQGWQPGTSLGLPDETGESVGLIEPLTLSSSSPRAGLGSIQPSPPSQRINWKTEGAQRRWEQR